MVLVAGAAVVGCRETGLTIAVIALVLAAIVGRVMYVSERAMRSEPAAALRENFSVKVSVGTPTAAAVAILWGEDR